MNPECSADQAFRLVHAEGRIDHRPVNTVISWSIQPEETTGLGGAEGSLNVALWVFRLARCIEQTARRHN